MVDVFPLGHAVFSQRKLQVFSYGERKWIGFLKNHPHAATQLKHVGLWRQHIKLAEVHTAGHVTSWDEIGESVEASQKTGLPTTRWPDQGRDAPTID